jgi:ribosomal protein S18 acetylase RimI-like enzyme
MNGTAMKAWVKRWWFGLRGKDPEAVIVLFRTGDARLSDAMCEEIRRLEPSRRHIEISADESPAGIRRKLRPYRIGLVPVLFTSDARQHALRRAAFFLAPRRILAYNERLERHHLSLSTPIASWLFLRGVPLDRIYLRPWWLWPFRKDKTVRPRGHREIEGRPRNTRANSRRKSIAVLTPYFPYPLAHGGAVRMFNLLREMAREFDVVLYAFTETKVDDADLSPVLAFTSRVFFVEKPRYREPRWSTLAPPEVGEYRSPEMARLIARRDTDLLQTEYTYLASYGGDVLVEHDVTFDLYAQVLRRTETVSAWWDWWRWRRYERLAVERFQRVVVMSEKDREMLGAPHARVIENGVDLGRFQPHPEIPGRRLLFIGSFRHFPNIVAFRFLTEQILPLVRGFQLTVVAGPEPWLHWRNYTGMLPPAADDRIRILEFVADVRPLYYETNLVLVPTLESAGTNVKVVEAMAMERAVVSTSSGCAGLNIEHGNHVWIADKAADFAEGIERLLDDSALRARLAASGRACAEQRFDWRAIGLRQRMLLRELLGDTVKFRPAAPADLEAITAIQNGAPDAAHWEASDYLQNDCTVAIQDAAPDHGRILGFLLSRQNAPGEREILNLAVAPADRRRGVARKLLEAELARGRNTWFLEVRASNAPALELYKDVGFQQVGVREGYYHDPVESAIVMRFFS